VIEVPLLDRRVALRSSISIVSRAGRSSRHPACLAIGQSEQPDRLDSHSRRTGARPFFLTFLRTPRPLAPWPTGCTNGSSKPGRVAPEPSFAFRGARARHHRGRRASPRRTGMTGWRVGYALAPPEITRSESRTCKNSASATRSASPRKPPRIANPGGRRLHRGESGAVREGIAGSPVDRLRAIPGVTVPESGWGRSMSFPPA